MRSERTWHYSTCPALRPVWKVMRVQRWYPNLFGWSIVKTYPINSSLCRCDSEAEIYKVQCHAAQEKALTWFKTPNPLLGDVRPIDMIRSGRGEKLCKWIDQTIREGE